MAVIKCLKCGAQIDDNLQYCGWCGEKIGLGHTVNLSEKAISIEPSQETVKTDEPKQETPKNNLKETIEGCGCLIFLVLAMLFGFSQCSSGDSSKGSSGDSLNKELEASTICGMAIKKLSRDPEMAKVPYVQGINTGTEIQFIWDSSSEMLRLRNGLGLEVATTGLCSVDLSTEEITYLEVEGQVFIE